MDTPTETLLEFHTALPFSVVSLWKHRQDPKIDWKSLKLYTPTRDGNILWGKDKNFGMVKEVKMKATKVAEMGNQHPRP